MFKKAAEKWRDDSYLRNRYITDLLLDYCTLGLVRGARLTRYLHVRGMGTTTDEIPSILAALFSLIHPLKRCSVLPTVVYPK